MERETPRILAASVEVISPASYRARVCASSVASGSGRAMKGGCGGMGGSRVGGLQAIKKAPVRGPFQFFSRRAYSSEKTFHSVSCVGFVFPNRSNKRSRRDTIHGTSSSSAITIKNKIENGKIAVHEYQGTNIETVMRNNPTSAIIQPNRSRFRPVRSLSSSASSDAIAFASCCFSGSC